MPKDHPIIAETDVRPEAIVARMAAWARRFETPCGSGTVVWRVWGDGPPLVLLHGSHGSWTHWIRNIDALAGGYSLWVPDLPGYGDSAHPPEDTQQSIAEVILAGLKALLPDVAVDLVGFSFGGVTAANLAALGTGLVRRVVLVGAGGLGTPMGEVRLRPTRGLEGSGRREAIRDNLLGLMLHHDEMGDAFAVHVQESNLARARLVPHSLVLPDRLIEVLPLVAGPVAAIWGAHDRPHPADQGQKEALHRTHPDAEFRVIAGAGHWVMFERPEAFNRTLLELLGH